MTATTLARRVFDRAEDHADSKLTERLTVRQERLSFWSGDEAANAAALGWTGGHGSAHDVAVLRDGSRIALCDEGLWSPLDDECRTSDVLAYWPGMDGPAEVPCLIDEGGFAWPLVLLGDEVAS